MLQAIVNRVSVLQNMVDGFKKSSGDLNVEFSDVGMTLNCMAGDRSTFISATVLATSFAWFQCIRPVTFNVDSYRLREVLKSARNEDTCVVVVTNDLKKMKLIFSAQGGVEIAEYIFPIHEAPADRTIIPGIADYEAAAMIPSTDFHRILKGLGRLSEVVCLEMTDQGVCFSANTTNGSGKVILPKIPEQVPHACCDVNGDQDEPECAQCYLLTGTPESNALTTGIKRKALAYYSLTRLSMISKRASRSSAVTLMMSDHHPLAVSYEFQDGRIQYLLAPLIAVH